jgi:hypothetical protein
MTLHDRDSVREQLVDSVFSGGSPRRRGAGARPTSPAGGGVDARRGGRHRALGRPSGRDCPEGGGVPPAEN